MTVDLHALVGQAREEADLQFRGGYAQRMIYADGTVRFKHRCDRGSRGVVICAPALKPGHRLTHVVQTVFDAQRLTITPSILCPDCGTHGFITHGRWADA